jgi:hypothetical protein
LRIVEPDDCFFFRALAAHFGGTIALQPDPAVLATAGFFYGPRMTVGTKHQKIHHEVTKVAKKSDEQRFRKLADRDVRE